MNIEILFRPPMRLWQSRLSDNLRAAGHRVWWRRAESGKRLAFGLGPALAVEHRLFGPSPSLFDTATQPDEGLREAADLVIALDGATSPAGSVLEPSFCGAPGDAGLIAMLTRGEPPVIRVRARRNGAVIELVKALVAIEDRDVVSRALDQVLAGLIGLIVQGVRRFEQAAPSPAFIVEDPSPAAASPLAYMASGLARKVAGRIPGLRRGPNHWRIFYRHVAGPGLADAKAWPPKTWPSQSFTMLADDGERFQADPMAFAHDGRTYLFFEDFPYATGKGVIGCVEIESDGTASASRTVLEQPYHLSYPLIIAHGDAIYMLPEMSAAGRIQLFRGDPFPNRWRPDRILVDGVVAADATPIWHDGRWWLFATLSGDGGSSWDRLGLFHAPDLLGPWLPHRDNPVLVDAGAARPAGAMWHEDGILMRVAQDCRDGYGKGLAICRVDRLDLDTYHQTVVARLGPPAGQGADGLHTLNRCGALEVVDFRYSRRPAIPRATGRD